MNPKSRKAFHELFYKRLIERRPELREKYEPLLRGAMLHKIEESTFASFSPLSRLQQKLESAGSYPGLRTRAKFLETIVSAERPVLFVRGRDFDTEDVSRNGEEANALIDQIKSSTPSLSAFLPLVGRIDVENFPLNFPFLGTGWFVRKDVVVTNRHVATILAEWRNRKFVFRPGTQGKLISAELNTAHEFNGDDEFDSKRICEVKEVLYIEQENGPHDIAFLRVGRPEGFQGPDFIPIASEDPEVNSAVCAIGYPARAPKRVIPDQNEMNELYRQQYDVKRACPGYVMEAKDGVILHDCSTLGGASGSVLMSLEKGAAVGLHYAGLYHTENYAVSGSILKTYVEGERWNRPPEIETSASQRKPVRPHVSVASLSSAPSAPGGNSVSASFVLTITASLSPMPAEKKCQALPDLTPASVENAAAEFWKSRPPGVVGARVGFAEDAGEIGDRPILAVSVTPQNLAALRQNGPQDFKGVPIQYFPADATEQLEAMPTFESVSSIEYDDDARTGRKFSFDEVEEQMEIILHVGPEYSWRILKEFLTAPHGDLVSAMYEFHADHIREALEERLAANVDLELVLDNSTFAKPKEAEDSFDRVSVFESWAEKYSFRRIVAPEGSRGLIANAYHIKVTVGKDNTFWLSSGNWKGESSQPVITDKELQEARAGQADLKGNREWHVVIKNETLATRFRSHILQDFVRSTQLGGTTVSKGLADEETLVDVPLDETVLLERPVPSRIIDPIRLSETVKVKPLLTPDKEGAVYSEAVLRLIRSAKRSLLFQIPYIGMPSNPRADRGYIDQLIDALVERLTTLDDARVILRTGGSKWSSPTHSAWYFKSKGVDIDNRLRMIENHHTKGMVVDNQRILLGSHNWSAAGVTLNRDASLLFDNAKVANYYAGAFEVDWERSRKIKPRKYVKSEAAILEAVGDVPPLGYVRMPLSEWLKDD